MIWEAILSAIMPAIEKALPDTAARDRAKAAIKAQLLDNQGSILQARAGIIEAEARSDGWLARNWRPLSMINFLALLDAYWMGYAPAYLVAHTELVQQLFHLLTVGIGGYIAGRSVEKVAPKVVQIVKGVAAPTAPPQGPPGR